MPTLTSSQIWLRRLAVLALLFTACVILLGAWTRLSDSGLGCPDWPTCYGHLDVFDSIQHVKTVNAEDPGTLRAAHKTIPEMVHRYFASTLGLLIVIVAALSLIHRRKARQPVKLPLFLVVLVIFQGMLGMWTVTLKLQPIIVMLHLIGGFTTLTLLALLVARLYRWPHFLNDCDVLRLRPFAWVALSALLLQIALGGWTAANYAAVACTELPICESGWPHKLDFEHAFTIWQDSGHKADFEYGVLHNDARTTIHVTHRFGAILVTLLILALVARILQRARSTFFRRFALVILALLVIQVSLGVSNILFLIPLPVAVAHNFCAVLLLISLALFIRAISVKCDCRYPQTREGLTS